MQHTQSLNGSEWSMKGFIGEDWLFNKAHLPTVKETRHWCPATVPGTVYHDLWNAGEISNPYFERNTRLAEWAADRTWLYKRTFRMDTQYRDRRVQLCFAGIDYDAEVFLNGLSLGTHVGMFTHAVFDVGNKLLYDEDNVLVVVIQPAPLEQPQIGRTSQVTTRKGRMSYGWDFCPRLVHLGIWDSVELRLLDDVQIEDVFVRPLLNDDYSVGTASVALQLHTLESLEANIQITVSSNGQSVVSTSHKTMLMPGQNTVQLALEVNLPRLW